MLLLSLIFSLSIEYGFDPYLILAVAKVESDFDQGLCYQGAYGVMQVQVLKHHRCTKRSRQIAKRRGYLDLEGNVREGVKRLAYWRRWCRSQGHSGHHWLLHYNQGYGRCPSGRKNCRASERKVNLKLERYSIKILKWQRKYKKEFPSLFHLTQYDRYDSCDKGKGGGKCKTESSK